MSSNPLVSVIIPFFNTEKFIEEAIESVFAQTYDHWELLLVNDGSTDGSAEVALRYAEQHPTKVHYLEHNGHQNRGVCASRNLGIRYANGDYIALLDADDVWLPHKLKQQVAILDSQPQAAIIYCQTQYWYSWTGNPEDLSRDYVPDPGVQVDTLFEPPTLLALLYPLGKGTAPSLSDLLMRREIIEQVGGFEEDFQGMYQLYEDQAFLVKAYLKGAVFVSSECLDRYRIHPNSCVSVVKETGKYQLVRLFFLNWLREYLSKHGVKDDKVWGALRKALLPYYDSMQTGEPEHHPRGYFERDIREIKWWLRVAGGNVANLEFPPNNPEMVRIAIKKAETKTSFGIQLNEPHLKVRSNHRYVINFLARADRPRSIILGFAKAHEPWTGLGLYREIDLTSEWQSFQEDFVATAGEDNARIHFDVGDSDIPVELSSVSLHSLSNGESIEPDLSHTRIYESERDKAAVEEQSDNWQPAEGREPIAREQTEQSSVLEKVRFGTLRRVTPISRDWGLDRGLPIDRYYIENFLSCHADCIRGRVLEVGDNSYTLKFGNSRVTTSDVLHVVEGNPRATIVGDLTCADHIPSNIFDCMILTQTLQLVYDVRAALKTIHRVLKPGGALLATFPGISQIYDREWGDRWYWSFTTLSSRRLFDEVFSAANVKVEAFGNVLVAISFLHGLAVEELTREELDHREPGYEVTITVKAVKTEAIA